MGAPMAAMLLEQLIALGARRFLYLGFCGALDATYTIGDLFMPTTAIREEGTSYHYLPTAVVPSASAHLSAMIQDQAEVQGLHLRSGPIWTTDAPYRETAHKIRYFQNVGAHAVDMEMAALLAVAQYRACDVCALMVVSDECYHTVWKPGFGATRLRQGCKDAVALALTVAPRLAALTPAHPLRS
jgi:uridine phosphorylase